MEDVYIRIYPAIVAIYRLEVRAISRGQGCSVVAAAAYRHAQKLQDDHQQMSHSYV